MEGIIHPQMVHPQMVPCRWVDEFFFGIFMASFHESLSTQVGS